MNFLNFLINDSIYLLDESLNKILELKELEAEMSNTVEWERRPSQERQERTRLFHSQENVGVNLDFSFLLLQIQLCGQLVMLLSTPELVSRLICLFLIFSCLSLQSSVRLKNLEILHYFVVALLNLCFFISRSFGLI